MCDVNSILDGLIIFFDLFVVSGVAPDIPGNDLDFSIFIPVQLDSS